MFKISDYNFISTRFKLNYYNFPKNIFKCNEEGAKKFNEVYYALIKNSNVNLAPLERTRSGGIKHTHNYRFRYDIQAKKNSIELTYIGPEGAARFIFNGRPDGMKGSKAFRLFEKNCKEMGVDLTEFAIENGEEVKKQIPNAPVELYARPDRVYLNAHHIDLNSSFMAGIAEYEPKLAPVILDIYDKRKENPINKDILTRTYGFMQSEWCVVKLNEEKSVNYAYAHLSKAAHEVNNRKIEYLLEELKYSGRRILATNTDGIWYTGELYHDEHEGTKLGQWKHDHNNCQIRFKSKGSYEYIENGKYTPVVRGMTKLDKIKSRDEWEWGDIYYEGSEIITFKFDYRKGIIFEYKNIGDEENIWED